MLETGELLVFSKIVATSSFSRAATELGMPRATVSRRLAELEEKLGVRLIRRTTRSMSVTDAGRELSRRAQLVLDAVMQAETSVRRGNEGVRGDVRVSVPGMMGDGLAGVIADFAVEHPAVRLTVHVSNGAVDLKRDGFDAAIRATGKLEPGLVARKLTRARLVGVASPTYLAAHGAPTSIVDLKSHRCLMGLGPNGSPRSHWTVAGKHVSLTGVAFSNDPHFVKHLAVRGVGIAFLPERLVTEQLARSELVLVLPKTLRLEGGISLVFADPKLMPPQVRAFVDWGAARAPAVLGPRT